jgi:hypothetical protein
LTTMISTAQRANALPDVPAVAETDDHVGTF